MTLALLKIDSTRGFEYFDFHIFCRKQIVLFQGVALSGHQQETREWQEESRRTGARCLQQIG